MANILYDKLVHFFCVPIFSYATVPCLICLQGNPALPITRFHSLLLSSTSLGNGVAIFNSFILRANLDKNHKTRHNVTPLFQKQISIKTTKLGIT